MRNRIMISIVSSFALVLLPGLAFAAATTEEMPISAKLVVGNGPAATSPATTNETPATAEALPPAPTVAEAPVAVVPKTDTSKLRESEIPVLTGAKDTKKSAGGGLSRILTTLGVLVVALGAAAYGIKRYAGRGVSRNQNTRIKVLTQHVLGPRKSLAIVQVAGEAILIGITDQNISMLKTIALIDDEFPDSMPRNFDSALDELGEEPMRGPSRLAAPDDDNFAVRGLNEIHDKVSTRLRNMKNL